MSKTDAKDRLRLVLLQQATKVVNGFLAEGGIARSVAEEKAVIL